MLKLECEKREHFGYTEWNKARKRGILIKQIIGQYQYIYSSNKGKISLVEMKDYFYDGNDLWEIYSLEGNLFEDVERFDTKAEAEERIRELLTKLENG